MEKSEWKPIFNKGENAKLIPGLHSIYRPPSEGLRSLPPHTPKGTLYLLKPKLVQPHTVPEHKRLKPPRFIPFEPYTCAISLISKPLHQRKGIKKNKEDVDKINLKVSSNSNSEDKNTEESTQHSSMEESEIIKKLKKERDYFKTQFKSQAQVNTEIKSLLVAVVGEDMQTKVNVLNEDKLQLAKALLDSMNNLSTHTEQVEFLTGQCEVWRSKFLASSVMIERLASWKAELTQKNDVLVNNNFEMLKMIESLRVIQIEILKNLIFLANLKNIEIPSGDIITIANESLNITQQMVLNSNFGIPNELNIKNLNPFTEIEKTSLQTIKNIKNKFIDTDDAFKAIVHEAKVKTIEMKIE